MTVGEYAQKILGRIFEIGQQESGSVLERLHEISHEALRFYRVLLKTQLANITNQIVPYGPFAGMRYINDDFPPTLLGSYEAELHPIIPALASRGYERVVNIGCGDGYYAVGLARLMPTARVFALDSDPIAQAACQSLAQLNGIAERVTVMGECTPAILSDLVRPGTLVFCDCEGAELKLLDPVAVPMLSQCDVLVEMHDFICAGASLTLQTRFRSTHSRSVIQPSVRDPAAYPILGSFSEFDRLFALCEFRPGPTPWGLFLSNTPLPTGQRE